MAVPMVSLMLSSRGIDPGEVIIDVAKVVAAIGTDRRPTAARELAGGLHHRRDSMLEEGDLAFQVIEPFDIAAGGALGKNLLLDFLEFRLQPVHDRKVAIDDRIHQGIEDKA